MQDAAHIPVMLDEVVAAFADMPGATIVDGTFGAGGYTRALLNARCKVIAIDRDPNVSLLAEALAREFPGHFLFLRGCFGDMLRLLADNGVTTVDGIVLDLGVSSMQIDQAERGFSFRYDAPLDMRMGEQALDAKTVINTYGEAELARILKGYGEERRARAVARAIVQAREEAPLETTKQLADLVASVVHKVGQAHPATRSFQAIRIAVNDELGELKRALAAAESLLVAGGKLVVVSFHSLEDRIVKQFMATRSSEGQAVSRHGLAALASQPDFRAPSFARAKPNKLFPQEKETQTNPRARSATMRIAIRTREPAWGDLA